jgi:hypothetical protein
VIMKIRPEMIAEWQRYCVSHPNGELTIATADGIEILKDYTALQIAPEFSIEHAPVVGKCVRVVLTWEIGERVRVVRMQETHERDGRRLRKGDSASHPRGTWHALRRSAEIEREQLVRHLLLAERHVAEGESRLLCQRDLVERLRTEKQDARRALELLRQLEDAQVLYVETLSRLREKLPDQSPEPRPHGRGRSEE